MGIFSFLNNKKEVASESSISHYDNDGNLKQTKTKPKSDFFPETIQEAYMALFFVCVYIDGTNEQKTAKFIEKLEVMKVFQYDDVDVNELLGDIKAKNLLYKFRGLIIGSCNRIGDDYKNQAFLDACEIMYADNQFTKPKTEILELLTTMLEEDDDYAKEVIENIKNKTNGRNKFKPGDIVELKSGSYQMTVISSDAEWTMCFSYDRVTNTIKTEEKIPTVVLELANK